MAVLSPAPATNVPEEGLIINIPVHGRPAKSKNRIVKRYNTSNDHWIVATLASVTSNTWDAALVQNRAIDRTQASNTCPLCPRTRGVLYRRIPCTVKVTARKRALQLQLLLVWNTMTKINSCYMCIICRFQLLKFRLNPYPHGRTTSYKVGYTNYYQTFLTNNL